MSLTKSKKRVADHGEVFTPPDLVEAMLDLVKGETERIDSRFLEPACGSGNFLIPVLQRKLAVVRTRYRKSEFERRHYALLAVMSIYGIELLDDNVAECRQNLLEAFASDIGARAGEEWPAAAAAVIDTNIVHGDALSMWTRSRLPKPITFAEWTYLGRGRYHRRDFRFDKLTRMPAFDTEGSLKLGGIGKNEIFTPVREYGFFSVRDLAAGKPLNV